MELVTNSNEFISFDSEETFSIKVSYASEQCLRGYMWWAVDMIDESFTVPIISPTMSPIPTRSLRPTNIPSASPAPTTLMPTPNEPTCPAGHTGWKACLEYTNYFYCQNGVVLGVPCACPDGTLYSEILQNCDWEDNVQCSTSLVTPPSPTPPPVSPPPNTPSTISPLQELLTNLCVLLVVLDGKHTLSAYTTFISKMV